MRTDAEALVDEIKYLVGFTVIGPAITSDKDLAGIQMKKDHEDERGVENVIVWILTDPEGNGGGFIDIEKNAHV